MRSTWFRTLVAAAAVSFSAVACSSSSTPTASQSGCTPAAQVTTKEPGKLIIGSDIPYPPFEYNKGSTLTGFDVELMNGIARALCLTPQWQDSHFGPIFTSLAANKFDVVAASVTAYAPKGSPAYKVTQQRAQLVNFSKPYYSSLQSLTVNTEKTPDIQSVDDLKPGDKVGVQSGTTGEFWAESELPSGVQTVGFDKAPDMFNALQAGGVVGVVNDLPASIGIIKNQPGLKVVQQIETGEQYAFCTNKTNSSLLAGINKELDTMFGDGTYAQIFKKYFPDQEMPSYASP